MPGFTLVEAMVTVAVIGILATLALPMLQGRFVHGQIVAQRTKAAVQSSISFGSHA